MTTQSSEGAEAARLPCCACSGLAQLLKGCEWDTTPLPRWDRGAPASPGDDPSTLVKQWVTPGPWLAIGTMEAGERRTSDGNIGFVERYSDTPLLGLAGWL